MTMNFPSKHDFGASYAQTKAVADSFEGMMNPLAYAIFEGLLSAQSLNGVHGNVAEYGVFKGRSASILLKHLRPSERAVLVDVKEPQLNRLQEINSSFEFILSKSEELPNNAGHRNFIAKGIRFSHHDASHTFNNVYSEMRLLEPALSKKGVMVLDDFANPHYLQVVAACFSRLAESDCDLEIFLYANNKAYLCKREDFDFYAKLVMNHLFPSLGSSGFSVQISRTNLSNDYRAFTIHPKKRPDMPDLYGLNFLPESFYLV